MQEVDERLFCKFIFYCTNIVIYAQRELMKEHRNGWNEEECEDDVVSVGKSRSRRQTLFMYEDMMCKVWCSS